MGKEVYLDHWSTLQFIKAVKSQLQKHEGSSYTACKVKKQSDRYITSTQFIFFIHTVYDLNLWMASSIVGRSSHFNYYVQGSSTQECPETQVIQEFVKLKMITNLPIIVVSAIFNISFLMTLLFFTYNLHLASFSACFTVS